MEHFDDKIDDWLITARETSKPLSMPRFRSPSLRSSPASDEEVVFEDFTELSLEVEDRVDYDDDADIYIMMQFCLSVTKMSTSSWESPVTT